LPGVSIAASRHSVVHGNDAAHCRDGHAGISGNFFSFARGNQGMVNDRPALSHPKAWIQFHATFDFFKWKMSSGACDSRSQISFSFLSTSFPLLYHLERELVSIAFEIGAGRHEYQTEQRSD
jgi:hypothetical protein